MKQFFLHIAIIILAAVPLTIVAQDSITRSARITFHISRADIDTDLGNNASELMRINNELLSIMTDSTLTLQRLTIHGFGSVDGPYKFNGRLASQRTDSLAAYVLRMANLPDGVIATQSTAEDWQGLLQFVEGCTIQQLPHRNQIIRIIKSNRTPGGKEWAIKKLYPRDYKYLIINCMPLLRRCDYTINYIRTAVVAALDTLTIPETTMAETAEADSLLAPEANSLVGLSDKSVDFYLRTNLLLPLLNFGFEMAIGNRWSIGIDYYYPWFPRSSNQAHKSSDHKNCFQIDGLALEGRCWLGSQHTNSLENRPFRLTGHSIGLFAMGGRFDLERNYSGHQGEYILGGVDYLYAMPIFKKRMHLELSLGVGYLYSRSTHYNVNVEGGKGYRDNDVRKIFEYFGPVKANVSLVIPLRLFKKVL